MTLKYCFVFVLCTLLLSTMMPIVVADDPAQASVVNLSNRGSYPLPSPSSTGISGGNVTQISLNTSASSARWVGVYGNLSGTLTLSDAGDNILYEWLSAEGVYVYASTSSIVDWASIGPATNGDVISFYGFLASGPDSFADTFLYQGAFSSVAVGIFANVPYALTYNNARVPTWKTFALSDGSSIIFAGDAETYGGQSFTGEMADYQMILPEDGLGNAIATEYSLWVELV